MSPALLQNGDVEEEFVPYVKSADEMDQERKEQIAYEYLCRLEEAKNWIETILNEKLPEGKFINHLDVFLGHF